MGILHFGSGGGAAKQLLLACSLGLALAAALLSLSCGGQPQAQSGTQHQRKSLATRVPITIPPALLVSIILLLLLLSLGVAACGGGLPNEMPIDFGFVFAYGVGARNEFDTFAGTFTKDMVVDPPVTTELRLSPEELAGLYRRMVDIGIEDYPRVFEPPDTGAGVSAMPMSYYLRLRADGRKFEISWKDENSSTAPEAKALRDLFRGLWQMIEAREEYKRLPEARGGYA